MELVDYHKTGNEWNLIVARRNSLLRINLIFHGNTLKLKNEINFDNNQILVLSFDNERGAYVEQTSLKRMGAAIVNRLRNEPNFIKSNVDRCVVVCNELVKTAEESARDPDLAVAFRSYVEKYYEFSPFMFFPIAIEKVVSAQVGEALKKIVPEKDFQATLETLTASLKVLDSTKEQKDLLNIALKIQSNAGARDALLNAHKKRYEYLNVYNQDEPPESIAAYKNRLNALLQTDVSKRIYDFDSELKQREENFNSVITKFNISGELLELVKLLREYVYLRSYRLEMLNKSNQAIQPLLEKIGRQIGLTLAEVCALTAEEITAALKGTDLPPKTDIQDRLCGYIYLEQGENYKIFTQNLREIKEIEFGKEKNYSEVKEITGTTGCKGKITGKVRVILNKADISFLQKGEVLVTAMTTPEYIMAMEKASAIVTDEGGVLCHAAIVSREMNKPCVIGAGISTKVFKTGDLVEVDGEKGTVRKIS